MQEIQVRVSRLAKLVFRQENTKVAPLHQIVFFFSNTEKKNSRYKKYSLDDGYIYPLRDITPFVYQRTSANIARWCC